MHLAGGSLKPSAWNGTYKCPADIQDVDFALDVTKATTNTTSAVLLVNGQRILMAGFFYFRIDALTLQTSGTFVKQIFGQNFTKVQLNGHLSSKTLLDGAMIFYDTSGDKICPFQLTRTRGRIFFFYLTSILIEFF